MSIITNIFSDQLTQNKGVFITAIIVGVLLLIFSFMQFFSMLRSKIPKTQKGLWILFFLVATFLTAIVWFFVKPKRKRRR